MNVDSYGLIQAGTSVIPQAAIIERIGGDEVEVTTLQRAGDSCGIFEPRPQVLAQLSKAQVYFRTGVAFEEALMSKIAERFNELQIVDLREAVELIEYEIAESAHGEIHHHNHDHEGEACEVTHLENDPHIWLDPQRVLAQAILINRWLSEIEPEKAAYFIKRTEDFTQRVEVLDEELSYQLKPYAGRAFYVNHPSLGYFAQRYGLRQIAISAAGQEPGPQQLRQLIKRAKADNVGAIFIQPQEDRREAQIIADAVGARLIEIDPMAADWEENLRRIGVELKAAFESEK